MRFVYIYVLLSKKDGRFYTGWTVDLRKRVQKHLTGKVYSTKNRLPLIVIYYEACRNKEDAKARERYLKSGMGKRFLKNRLKNFLSEDL